MKKWLRDRWLWMKWFCLTMALLIALPVVAQTPITVQNPSFSVSPSAPNAGEGGNWGYAPISGWTVSGSIGLWQPDTTGCGFSSAAGQTLAWINSGTLSQDLTGISAVAGQTYSLTVQVGLRGCFGSVNYTISLMAGSSVLCTINANNSALSSGTLVTQTISCPASSPAPVGDLNIVITVPPNQSGQLEIGTVGLSLSGPPAPYVFQLQGGPSIQFPMSAPPACGASDGTCSIQIQVVVPASSCSTDPTGQTMTCTGTSGQINLLKNITLPVPQTQTIPVAVTQ